jgi:hypothetical protein
MPSHRYRWNTLDRASFHAIGVIARRSPDGAPRFNFPQMICVYPRVKMNWSPHLNRQVETLGVNILGAYVLSLPRRNRLRAIRFTLDESRAFAELVLCTMPQNGGCIPRMIIQAWIREALQIRSRKAETPCYVRMTVERGQDLGRTKKLPHGVAATLDLRATACSTATPGAPPAHRIPCTLEEMPLGFT